MTKAAPASGGFRAKARDRTRRYRDRKRLGVRIVSVEVSETLVEKLGVPAWSEDDDDAIAARILEKLSDLQGGDASHRAPKKPGTDSE